MYIIFVYFCRSFQDKESFFGLHFMSELSEQTIKGQRLSAVFGNASMANIADQL
jgi:hypothetical protein